MESPALGLGLDRVAPLLQLEQHQPHDAPEREALGQMLALLHRTPAPLSREQFSPGHLTASAIVVDRSRTKTLLIYHAKLQRWLQPGGHFEPGEREPFRVALREAREETGLSPNWFGRGPELLDVDVHQIPGRRLEPAHLHFDLRFLLTAAGTPRPGEGTLDARWVSPAELPGLGLDPSLERALSKVAWAG